MVGLIESSGKQSEFFGVPFHPYSYAHAMWGYSTGLCGDFREAEKLLERALSLTLETDHTATIGTAQYFYGLTVGLKGDGQEGRQHLENAIKYMEASHSPILLGPAWAALGYAQCLLGQPDMAVELTEKGLKMHTDLGMVFLRSFCEWECSYAHLEANNMAQARAHADLALEFALENNERLFQSTSRMLLGYVLSKAEPGQIEEAEQQILQGINIADELGLPVLSGPGYLFLGQAYGESGRRQEALENLKKAESMHREMGMDYWLNKAQEALARLGG
jgi:tetratricopeptide (TPR) repeat protein